MMSIYKHTAQVTGAVHDELIKWARELLQDAGLDVIDVWGRFPPEGTTRSHLVLFPYRVGPEERMIDNAPGANLILPTGTSDDRGVSVSPEWMRLGNTIADQLPIVFPNVQAYDPRRPPTRSPFPPVSELAPPLRAWYEAREPNSGWVVSDGTSPHARPPSMFWRKGIRVSAYYMVVAGDPGRGTSQRTSDNAPLSLSALSVLSVGIQRERSLSVEIPPRPVPEDFLSWTLAYTEALEKHHDLPEEAVEIRGLIDLVKGGMRGEFELSPVHDLNNQEFALLTQALQRPLEAILNIRLRIPVGNWLDFQPGTTVHVNAMNKDNKGGRREGKADE